MSEKVDKWMGVARFCCEYENVGIIERERNVGE